MQKAACLSAGGPGFRFFIFLSLSFLLSAVKPVIQGTEKYSSRNEYLSHIFYFLSQSIIRFQ